MESIPWVTSVPDTLRVKDPPISQGPEQLYWITSIGPMVNADSTNRVPHGVVSEPYKNISIGRPTISLQKDIQIKLTDREVLSLYE